MRLYLASTSPARLATLRAAGVEPVVLTPDVDEGAVAADAALSLDEAGLGGPALDGPALDGPALVRLLARAKAEAVLGRTPIDGFVLGGDSTFELDGVLYGKPHLPEIARERWRAQRGRTGLLHSGHWLIDHRGGVLGNAVGGVSTASVTFADSISDDEIDAYIATGEPLRVAGAFTIDSLGAPYISAIEGDPHAVVGLSVAMLRTLLLEFGVAWHTLWNRQPL